MKKLLVCFSLLVFYFPLCHAKDTIVFTNGKRMVAKVTSVDDFVNYTDPAGKNENIRNKSVAYIHYSSGERYSPNRVVEPIVDKTISAHNKWFSIYNEPMDNFFCESANIGIEYPICRRITLGINFAVSQPQSDYYVNPLSSAQANWPGTIYYGYAWRFNCKLFDKNKAARYTAFQFVVKSLWYRDVEFYDQPSEYGDNGVYYTRNEDETVFGLDIVRGHEYSIIHDAILIDYYYGIGFCNKLRHIDTWDISSPFIGAVDDISYGYSFQNKILPTPILGIRIGFNFYKRPNKKFPVIIGSPPQTETTH